MTKIGTAIYENGVFKPEQAVTLESGARVDIIMADDAEVDAAVAAFENRFPGVVGWLSPEEADKMRQDIDEQFGCPSTRAARLSKVRGS